MTNQTKTIAIVGGGAAGFFGAIACAEASSDCRVILLEKNRQLLTKVRVSGGGRCNVTHACFDPAELIKNYPRGGKELQGAFTRFQPRDTIQWFESRGVSLKTEADGRMFPITDKSETIIECLMQQAKNAGVEIWTEKGVVDCCKREKHFQLVLTDGQMLLCDCLLIATGSTPRTFEWLSKLGHTIVSAVPSLFTFNIPDSPLHALSGISVPKAALSIEDSSLQQVGPLLITHWGFSGPAVLKLSAWGARVLHEKNYKAKLKVNWLPDLTQEDIKQTLMTVKGSYPTRLIISETPFALPKNLWKALLEEAGITSTVKWTDFSKQHLHQLVQVLNGNVFQIDGKSTYKEEFVTCGGVSLKEVNFKTMESRRCPGLYFAGEVLDVDGVTGGFNFQNAWTTSWLAGKAMAASLNEENTEFRIQNSE